MEVFADSSPKPLNQWFSLFPSRGMSKPSGHKRAQTEDAGSESESEAEGLEAEAEAGDGEMLSEDYESQSRWSRLLLALKLTRKLVKKERATGRAEQKKAHPPTYPRSIGGPIISKEEAQMCIAMERSLKEHADREAVTSRGKEKLTGP
ncbi:hypothetical protein LWI29_020920 [Acer saccharum]|uniref:Uncharacterized protein n=1 Tax=Acer saccharum TaxID=4024 RepID=A0AA39SD21_ACESA|nr:hypothetical protein LWI29_020920 [Acer saccharum]